LNCCHLPKGKEIFLMEPQIECEPTTNEPIQNTSQTPNEQQGSDQQISEKPTKFEPKTDHGAAKSSQFCTLLDLSRVTFTLDGEEVLNAQDATNEQFAALAEMVATVSNVEQWYLEERRDFINGLYTYCQEHHYEFPFVMRDEETVQTQPLEQQESGFLHDVERARPLMEANPDLDANGLAQALGWKSAIYAQTIRLYVNAHHSTEEETH
jgi:hypothetical protein